MNFIKTGIEGVVIIEPRVFEDSRGYFFESFNLKEFEEAMGPVCFVQDTPNNIISEGVLLTQDVSFVNSQERLEIWVAPKFLQNLDYLGEGIVGDRNLVLWEPRKVFGGLFNLVSFSINAQKGISILHLLVLDQPDERNCQDSASFLLDSQGGRSASSHTLVQYAVGWQLTELFFSLPEVVILLWDS